MLHKGTVESQGGGLPPPWLSTGGETYSV